MPPELPQHPHAVIRAIKRVAGGLYRWAASGWAGPAAFSWSFLQSSVVPGPSDALFLPLGLAEPKRAPILGVWTTGGAMLGGLTAYAIGALAFHSVGVPLLGMLGISHHELARFETLFATKGWIVILLGSMPVFSSKLTALAAGAFGFPVMEFLLVSFLIRGTRFLSMGFVLRYGSPYVRRWLRRNEPEVVTTG